MILIALVTPPLLTPPFHRLPEKPRPLASASASLQAVPSTNFSVLSRRLVPVLTAIALGLCATNAQDVLNGIAAVVNDQVVTFSQVRELVGAKEHRAPAVQGEALVSKIKEITSRRSTCRRELILEFKSRDLDRSIHRRASARYREFGGDRHAQLNPHHRGAGFH